MRSPEASSSIYPSEPASRLTTPDSVTNVDSERESNNLISHGAWKISGIDGIIVKSIQPELEFDTLFGNPLPNPHETMLRLDLHWREHAAKFKVPERVWDKPSTDLVSPPKNLLRPIVNLL